MGQARKVASSVQGFASVPGLVAAPQPEAGVCREALAFTQKSCFQCDFITLFKLVEKSQNVRHTLLECKDRDTFQNQHEMVPPFPALRRRGERISVCMLPGLRDHL